MENNIVLWGSGIIGVRYCRYIKLIGFSPISFIDSDCKKWDSVIEDVPVHSPDYLKKIEKRLPNFILMLSCRSDEVYSQAIKLGVDKKRIYSVDFSLYYIFKYIIDNNVLKKNNRNFEVDRQKVAFDLQNGAALGGVETWSLEQGEKIKRTGKKTTYIIGNCHNNQLCIPDYFKCLVLNYNNDIVTCIGENVDVLNKSKFGVVISNFANINMMSNCYYKRLNNNVRHIMVIHNDELPYFQLTILMQEYIDYCLVISERIKEKLIKGGFNKDKVIIMNWNIEVDSGVRFFNKNDVIKIGYAGRVTSIQKRLDYIPKIIEKLEQEKIDYLFEIAGIGDYYEELSGYVERNNLKEKVILLGMLDKNKMRDFWRGQDIYISCSDWEGHSISQCEGIACGAVPVVTDVSGVSDDIQNGVTGYIVPVGDWEAIVDRIVYLSKHRDVLKKMSDAGMNRMRERNSLFKDNILEELCH